MTKLDLEKQYKHFPDPEIFAEEIAKALPKQIPPATDSSIVPSPTLVPQLP